METPKIIFSGKNNMVYEGIYFENGIFQTSDPDKIARLRRSSFYGKEVIEFDPNEHDGGKNLDDMTVAELKPMVKDQDWLKAKHTKSEIIAKIREETE